ncbi:MAG: DUF402 domain-containing protein [Clostridia bacterium]
MIMRSLKYDQRPHYEQELEFVEQSGNHLLLRGRKGRILTHHTRGEEYTFDKNTFEYFFPDRWYTAALVLDERMEATYLYCNIAMPARIGRDRVEFVDLDVDVILEDGEIRVVDLDEYEHNRASYGYPEEVQRKVTETVEVLKRDIQEKRFPFNGDYRRFIR